MQIVPEQCTWKTYSELWAEEQLPRGRLDEWVLAGKVRWVCFNGGFEPAYMQGKPQGMYYCLDDITGRWENVKVRDAVARLGGEAEPGEEEPRYVHPGPYGATPAKRR